MFDPRSIPAELRSSDRAIAARIEDAGLTASQPSQQSFYDGWLLRYSATRSSIAASSTSATHCRSSSVSRRFRGRSRSTTRSPGAASPQWEKLA
jgi:hypothetical protein